MMEKNNIEAETRERTKGVWVYTEVTGGLRYWYCSACKNAYHRKDPHDRKYCYYCGAKMKMEGARTW